MIVESYEDSVILTGALRTNQWETLHTAIAMSLRGHPTGVVIDCSGLVECTPLGADTFRSVMEYIADHDARVIVAAVPETVMSVLRSVPDVRSQLPIVGTVEEARRSLDLLGLPEPDHGKKRKLKLSDLRVVAVVQGDDSDDQVLWTAREIVNNLNGLVQVVFPLVVPRELPLQAALPEVEQLAKTTLEKAGQLFEGDGTPHEILLERGRDVAGTVASALEENPAAHVIVGLPRTENGTDECGKLVRTVLAKVKCAVIFVRPATG